MGNKKKVSLKTFEDFGILVTSSSNLMLWGAGKTRHSHTVLFHKTTVYLSYSFIYIYTFTFIFLNLVENSSKLKCSYKRKKRKRIT